MFKRYFLILTSVFVSSLLLGQNTCPTINDFSINASLPNPCVKVVISQAFYNPSQQPITVTINYGDGSPVVSNNYSAASNFIYASTTHTYNSTGTFSVTLTLINASSCSASQTKTITTSCSSCLTGQTLSTGFDRANNTTLVNNEGNFDPYWYVVKKQLIASTTFTPIPGTETYYSNLPAYDIVPNGGYGVSLAPPDAKYISLNSSMFSQDPSPYIVTYRTYFVLPSTLPTNIKYSLLMSMRADDGIYQVSLNGTDIKPPGYITDGNSYSGNAYNLSINSCDQPVFVGDTNYIDITAADTYLAASQFVAEILLQECAVSCTPIPPCGSNLIFPETAFSSCANQEICYVPHPRVCTSQNQQNFTWNFGDGSPTITGCSWCHTYTTAGTYTISVTVSGNGCTTNTVSSLFTVNDCFPPPPCEDCIGSFAPIPTATYIVSAWVKEGSAPLTKTSYTYPNVVVKCPSVSFTSSTFLATGEIIDGWQRIEGEFTIPASASDISIELNCTSPTGDCFFDDVRVFPTNGSMKSYVYDPVNMRLVAELDERNYATMYEYDEEGKLVRVKKETAKGIMTIKESRNNSSK